MRACLKGMAPEWWDLPGQESESDPVAFYLKPLDGLEWTRVLMNSYDPGSGIVSGGGIIEAFKLGVKNWRNIEDPNAPGEMLEFKATSFGRIPPAWIMEAGQRVLAISRVNAAQVKN